MIVRKKKEASEATEKKPAKKPARAKAAKASKSEGGVVDPRHYDVVRSPIITEKSTGLSELNKAVFKVARDASKEEIKSAVEALFKVKVVKVNTLNRKGKTKNFRGRPGFQSDFKKAVVTLEAGQSIDIAAGAR